MNRLLSVDLLTCKIGTMIKIKIKMCFSLYVLFITLVNSQLAYPEEHPLPMAARRGINKERHPVYAPGVCPENQWYWPGDQETDWICDCASRFVYYPQTDMCHELYRQGPCKQHEYLILQKGKILPECVQNPCLNDTVVPFNGNCYSLYKSDACPPLVMGGGTLNVNHTSLELECLPSNAVELVLITVPPAPCPPGSKRISSGSCRKIIK